MVFCIFFLIFHVRLKKKCESLPLWSPNLCVFHVELWVCIGVCEGVALGVCIENAHPCTNDYKPMHTPYTSSWLWSDTVGGRRRRAKALRRRPPQTNFPLPSRPGSALRHWELDDCLEVADSVDARACPQKTADIDGLRYSPDDPHCGLGPVHTSLYVQVTWDWWLGHLSPELARAETGGADQWVLKRRELSGLPGWIN